MGVARVKLQSPEFAADPTRAYEDLRRRYGPVAPIELADGVPATLVLGYREALRILGDPEHFPADPRGRQYRSAYLAAVAEIDQYRLRSTVESAAMPLINGFCGAGYADLLADYARPLTLIVLSDLIGFPPRLRTEAGAALLDLAEAADTATSDLAERQFRTVLAELVAVKRDSPGRDVVSTLIGHADAFDDTEIVDQLTRLCVMGAEPTWNLIVNTLVLMADDTGFHDDLMAGSLQLRDAIDSVLFTDPPLANACPRFPQQPQVIASSLLPANQPVLISITACNNDPAVSGDHTGNRSHLAWGRGPHTCPAQPIASIIAREALDQLLDALPEIKLAIPLTDLPWRPSTFHRAPAAVPVTFPPSLPVGPRA
ncbi:cytochrome P450 [Nocardia sp. ET3-3]|uniref:Cytochrome P450 n=1 Tax=Nocardia terrae TaxID=2675851 RepID=A0A7K1V1C5_9NOCA|nr:cytochrome P450 [Nocardia terrae]MVU80405.1 cytochrome P450 [Nocardia terrae]